MLTGDMLRLTAARVPRRVALICGHERLDYATLEAEANRFAHALLAEGLGKGSNIAIMSSNRIEYPAVHFGAAKSGCILANLPVRYAPDELAYVLNKAEIELLVVERRLLDLVAAVRGRAGRLGRVVVLGGGAAPDATSFADFIADHPGDPPAVEIAVTDPFSMTYTGGTTGFPKGVLVNHRARAITALTGVAQYGLDEHDVVAMATPLYHVAGLFVWYQPVVILGATCVLLPSWDPELFAEVVQRERVTAVLLVPTQLNDILEQPEFDPAKFESLRNVSYAGAPMPKELMQALLEVFPNVAFTENYGQSETGALAVKPPRYVRDKMTSAGRPAVGIELRVVDEQGVPVAPGVIGEIVSRGPHLMTEYFNEPEQTAALDRLGDGWLWTGDLATVDEDGFLTLRDRSRDIIITGGENIFPAEVENALYAHEAVAECAVFGIPDERRGEIPAAAVVLKRGAEVTEEELIEFCATRIARFKRPRRIEFMDDLPKTGIGKVRRNVLREPYWRGRERAI